MSYLMFLVIFILPPIIVFSAYFLRSKNEQKKLCLWGIVALLFLAVTYTTPWDNYLVKTNVWSYGSDRVLGTIGYVPIEEYMFFILQTIMTGLFCFYIQTKIKLNTTASKNFVVKHLVTVSLILITGIGVRFLYQTSTTYMGLILAWATPVVLLQWAVGGQYILNNLKVFLLSTSIPTVYLWLVDSYAINDQIWDISNTKTIGLNIGILPLEEATFFLLTNIMVVQGLMLFLIMLPSIKPAKKATG